MSDLERLKELLDSWGVPYEEAPGGQWVEGGWHKTGTAPETHAYGPSITTSPLWHDHPAYPKVDGYTGFFTRFEFKPDGSFEKMGAWE